MNFIPTGKCYIFIPFHSYRLHIFVNIALKTANDKYREKLSSGKAVGDKDLYSLSWSVDELGRLNSEGRELYVEISALMDLLNDNQALLIQDNAARCVSKLKERLLIFIYGVTRHQRQKATHILVTMISPCDRRKKPYALPICSMPYSTMNEKSAHSHISAVILEMNTKITGEYDFTYLLDECKALQASGSKPT